MVSLCKGAGISSGAIGECYRLGGFSYKDIEIIIKRKLIFHSS